LTDTCHRATIPMKQTVKLGAIFLTARASFGTNV
jgi:hypothetical protein